VNWINTNISKIQIYFNKKDYLILGVVVLLCTNLGLGLGYVVHSNYFAKPEIYKNANANLALKDELLDVELGVTIEEQEILNQIQSQNELSAQVTATTALPQSRNSTSSKPDDSKFTEIEAPKDPTKSETIKPEVKIIAPAQGLAPQETGVLIETSNIQPKTLAKSKPKEINDLNGRKITYNLQQFGINAGYIWDTDISELGQSSPFQSGVTDNQSAYFPTSPKHIEQLIPAQDNCPNDSAIQGQKNWLSFGKYRVEAPIINGSFGDFYSYGSDGQINLNSEIIEDQNAIARGNYESVPVQKLLKAGVVHLPISPALGQVGNSFIVGHTSNFPQVKSNYNTIFKPFESKSRVGDEFTIWDHKCRQMTFRVFEAFAIGEYDTDTAYQNMGNRRVVTLQGSILDASWQPTKRWLTRGELVE
jgi:hypothetical protein